MERPDVEWFIGFVILFPLAVVLFSIATVISARRARRRFWAGRTMLSDADFCLHVCPGTPTDHFFWLAYRRAMAESIQVPTESLHPDDTVATLSRMVSPIGLDFLDVVFRLEKWLNISIPRDLCATEGMSREEWAAFRQQTTTLQGMGNYMVKGLKALVAQKSKDAIPPTTP